MREMLPMDAGREHYEAWLTGVALALQVTGRHRAALHDLMVSLAGSKVQWRPLELRYSDRRVIIGGREQCLPAADFAFYAVMVRRRLEGRDFVSWDVDDFRTEYKREYRKVTRRMCGNRERVENGSINGSVERPWFEVRKSNVNRVIRPFSEWPGEDYGIVTRGRKPNTRSGVIVDPRWIRIRDGPSVGVGGISDRRFSRRSPYCIRSAVRMRYRGSVLFAGRGADLTAVRPPRQMPRPVRGDESAEVGVGFGEPSPSAWSIAWRASSQDISLFEYR